MKSDWMVFSGTLVLVGALFFGSGAWRTQGKFLCYFQAQSATTKQERVSLVERVMYAAALSATESAEQESRRGKRKCPEALRTSGHAI